MNYEKMTGKINLEELEVQAEEVTEASGIMFSCPWDGPALTIAFDLSCWI